MKLRPTIFLSGVSSEFASFRDAVEIEIEKSRHAAEIPLVTAVDFRADISRISHYAPNELVGRDSELRILDDAWLKVRGDILPRPKTFLSSCPKIVWNE